MGHALAFWLCMIMEEWHCVSLGLYHLCPLHQLQAGYAPDSNSHMEMLSEQWHKS